MLLQLKNISYGYNTDPVIDQVNFDIKKGDFVGMIGPNGGGKSTIIKIIMGLLKPWSGTIDIGKNDKGAPISIGYLPQYHEFDKKFPISVEDVILSGLHTANNRRARISRDDRKKAKEALALLGLESYNKRAIGELSGGQMQRVFLGRSMISQPDLLILDEPVTYVDNRFENEMYQLLESINSTTGILLVSHDVGQIVSFVKTIACVNGTLHYHPSNRITDKVLESYNCPIDLITHGKVPHRVLHNHS